MDLLGILVGISVIIWTALSWILDKFWFLIILIFIYFNRYQILSTIMHLFFHQYNESYPAFSKLQIGATKLDALDLSKKWSNLVDKSSAMMKKQKDQSKNLKNTDLSEESKDLYKFAWECYYKSQWEEKKADFMIEANNEVVNGKKTIQEVKEDFEKKFSGWTYLKESDQHFKKWELS